MIYPTTRLLRLQLIESSSVPCFAVSSIGTRPSEDVFASLYWLSFLLLVAGAIFIAVGMNILLRKPHP